MKLRHIQTGAVGARTTRLRDGALPPWPPASPQFGPYSGRAPGRAPGRAGDVRRLRSRTGLGRPDAGDRPCAGSHLRAESTGVPSLLANRPATGSWEEFDVITD